MFTFINFVVGFILSGKSTIGNGKEGSRPAIVLNGPRIAKEHAVVTHKKEGSVFLKPLYGLVLHNGKELLTEIELEHQDRHSNHNFKIKIVSHFFVVIITLY